MVAPERAPVTVENHSIAAGYEHQPPSGASFPSARAYPA
jgi:hypothetical protein